MGCPSDLLAPWPISRTSATVPTTRHAEVTPVRCTEHDGGRVRIFECLSHKAHGMTADVALVVGSEAASREWAYSVMSRARVETRYFTVASIRQRATWMESSTVGRKSNPWRSGWS